MSRYRFELATPADDADLCAVLAATPTDGRIAVTFRRDPSWFAGAVVDGRFRQVVACRDLDTGRVIAFACRSVRDVYVNGRPAAVGYLSGLRVLPGHRNRGLLARGYARVRGLHADGRAPFYLTTIAAGNRTALEVLTSGRAGLPAYHPAGMYHTIAIPIPRRMGPARAGRSFIRTARMEDLPAILDFLTAEGPRRQFFPWLLMDDLLSPDGAMRELALDRFLLAERAGRIIGMLAGWDQHADRRSEVHSYRGWLRWARPAYNVWSWVHGRPGLPRPGGALRYLVAALPVIAGDDAGVFTALLDALRIRAAGGPWSHLLLGLHDADPLLRAARRYAAAEYVTYVFLVCWADGEAARQALDGRPPYLELGSL
jgi:hypothetical protein